MSVLLSSKNCRKKTTFHLRHIGHFLERNKGSKPLPFLEVHHIFTAVTQQGPTPAIARSEEGRALNYSCAHTVFSNTECQLLKMGYWDFLPCPVPSFL